MFQAPPSPYLVPTDGSFSVSAAPTAPADQTTKSDYKKQLSGLISEMRDLQRRLYASDKHSVLMVFQAMDAAGKDGTIRAVMSGINPAGCQVYSFKQPSKEELDHDFLWRTSCALPERGRFGIFNRSYYEEVLIVKVHPKILGYQQLPDGYDPTTIFEERYDSIRDLEKHLARNGTIVLKFWLNVSKGEQKRRFLDRIDRPHKNWKFSSSDVRERGHWDAYMAAYEDALNATSRSYAPWYAIPADNKPYMRVAVAEIVVEALRGLNLKYPELNADEKAKLGQMRELLTSEED